eukprot:1154279-Pelagomonas_calceolata.AAC.12
MQIYQPWLSLMCLASAPHVLRLSACHYVLPAATPRALPQTPLLATLECAQLTEGEEVKVCVPSTSDELVEACSAGKHPP